MGRIELLLRSYRKLVELPWTRNLAGKQRIWFAVYPKEEERRLRLRVDEFEIVTKEAGHGWHILDLTDAFPAWMAKHRHREAYFEDPEALDGAALKNFHQAVMAQIRTALQDSAAEDSVFALLGVGALFGFMKVSDLIGAIEDEVPGRMLVFFPGERTGNSYRLLDARDGWNYMAVAITGHEAETN